MSDTSQSPMQHRADRRTSVPIAGLRDPCRPPSERCVRQARRRAHHQYRVHRAGVFNKLFGDIRRRMRGLPQVASNWEYQS